MRWHRLSWLVTAVFLPIAGSVPPELAAEAGGPVPGATAGGPPGEASELRVVAYSPSTGALTLNFQPACGATGHHIEFGPLSAVATHAYTGQVCGIGVSGSFGPFDPGPGSSFFLVVGDDGAGIEGSYGLAFAGGLFRERQEDLATRTP